MKKERMIPLIAPAAALVLELLPYGAVLNFANPDGEPWRRTFSYFSLIPFGYADFGPLLTAVLTCAVLAAALIFLISGKAGALKAAQVLSGIAVCTSLMPLLFGIRFFSWIGAAITAALACEFFLLRRIRKTE